MELSPDRVADEPLELTLYVREGCHLCDEMRNELAAVAAPRPLSFTLVDIDADDALLSAYDHKVPVLTLGDYEICHFFLDQDALEAVIRHGGPPA